MAGPTRSASNWSTGAGHTDYSSSSTPGFIPEIWSGKLVERFYNASTYAAISNTDYEGEIKGYGDNIIIRTIPDITIGDYELGQSLTYQQPTSTKVEMPINKAKYFSFQVDSVDSMQSDLNLMNVWSGAASEQMKVSIDTDVLGNIYTGAAAANAGTAAGAISGSINLGATAADGSAAIQITSSTVLDYIVKLGQVLDEQNCPEEGRYIVAPAWFCAKIKLSDLKDASITGDNQSIARNGRVGMIDRFEIFMSNNVANATETAVKVYHVIAGHKKATAFASQMTNMESLPNPSSFGELVRGLNVYGYKVVNPVLLAHGVVKE